MVWLVGPMTITPPPSGSPLPISQGGTSASNALSARYNLGGDWNAYGDANLIGVPVELSAQVPTPITSGTQFAVNHNLSDSTPIVQVYHGSQSGPWTNITNQCAIVNTSFNDTQITVNVAIPGTGEYVYFIFLGAGE
jgi:hypothetical protein